MRRVRIRSGRDALGLIAALTAVAGWAPRAASAEPYRVFTNVADSSGPYSSFGEPSINDAGTVAFTASLDTGVRGVFRGGNPATDAVATSTGPYTTAGFQSPFIGNNGKVAFEAGLDSGGYGIFTGADPVADALGKTSAAGGTFQHLIGPAVSAQGNRVVFNARFSPVTVAHVFRGPDAVADRVIDMTSIGGGWATHIDVNDSGTVAFWAGNIYKGSSTATVVPVVTTAGPYAGFETDPAINNAGMVAFLGFLDAGGSGIFTGPNPLTDTVADTSGPFSSFDAHDINDSGLIVFRASLDAGGAGIYVGPDPIADKVIASGDALFGSTITSLSFTRALNNNGDVAFGYGLADGRHGIAVASVPEPAAFIGAAGMAGALGLRRRTRNDRARRG